LIFNDGPLAWNGVIAFWVPLAAFVVWMVGITIALRSSIKAEEALLEASCGGETATT